jgi:hypothetical protein
MGLLERDAQAIGDHSRHRIQPRTRGKTNNDSGGCNLRLNARYAGKHSEDDGAVAK